MTQNRNEWQTYRRLLHFTKPYLGRLVLGLLFGAIFGSSLSALLLGLKKTLATVFDPSELTIAQVASVAFLLPAVALIRGVGDYLSTYFIEWVGHRVVMDLRNHAFAKIQSLSLGYFTNARTGEIISRVINDSTQVERSVSTVLGDVAKQPFALIGALGFLLWLDPKLSFIGLVLFPIAIFPVLVFGKRVRRFAKQGQERLADLVSTLQESVAGVKIVKAFSMEDYELKKFAEQSKAVFSRAVRVTRAKAAVEPIIVTITMLGLSLVLIYVKKAGMTIDQFFTFAAAMIALYDPVKKLSRIHITIQQSSAAADRIFELIDAPVTVQEKPRAVEFSARIGEIAFDAVSFAYADELVLREVSLSVKAGQRVAFVGSSGSGKTTLVSLIPRFYDPTKGRVTFNGQDVRDFTISSLRKQVGIVTQDTFLFNDTVTRNIAYGQENASQELIEAAAKKAQAHEFIKGLANGYETVIGERGVMLSGGQCQRLSIARAILRNPPVLILDEATSALDTEAERQVQAALDELMTGRTVFAIAHRLSTITSADCICVLDKGQIIERGTHDELLARGGAYKRLYDLQFHDAE